MEKGKTFYQELAEIQQELNVKKTGKGRFGEFANLPDMLAAIKPLLKDKGLVLTLSNRMIEVGGRTYVATDATLSNGVDQVTVCGQAWEGELSRGLDSSQVTGSASTYARKYALSGLFAIGDGSKDADSHKDAAPVTVHRSTVHTDIPATPKQRGYIKGLLTNRGIEDEFMPNYLEEEFGVKIGSTMTVDQASNIIETLQGDEKDEE